MTDKRGRPKGATSKPKSIIHIGERICLKCLLPFKSTGPWNRICTKCNEVNQRKNADARGPSGTARRRGIDPRQNSRY